jgi:hypothetical protein
MRKTKTKIVSTRNLTVPGKALSKAEFKELVQEAESDTFHEVSESKALFQGWRKKNYKL